MKFTKIAVSSFSLGLLLSLFSCIDNDYDLGKELNLEVSVGGNLSLPIGETEQIKLDRLLEEGDVLHVIDGKYVINKADNISESVDAIDPVVIDDFAPEFTPYTVVFQKPTDTTIPDIPGLEIPEIEIAFDANIHTVENFDVHTDIPEEIKSISYVAVTDNNREILHTTLDIAVEGLPSFLPCLYLSGVELSLPDILDFEVEQSAEIQQIGSSIFISQKLELVDGNGVISIPITILGISNPIVQDGVLTLTDEVAIKGRVYADKQSVGVDDLENYEISVRPQLTLPTPEIRVDKVAGSIVPNVDINTSVSLSDLPDFLKEDGTSLEVKDLSLNLSVLNPIEAPIKTQFEITPLDEVGNIIDNNLVSLSLTIQGGQQNQFNITKDSPEITSGSLTSLLRSIPDQINLKVTQVAIESTTESEAISLGKEDYNLDIDYDINVPLEFDNLCIIYRDTIENLSDDLSDITDKVKNIELAVEIDNAIPLGLSLSIDPRDVDGNPIQGISYPQELEVKAGPAENGTGNTLSVTTSNLVINLKEEQDDALQKLDKLYLKIEGRNGENNDVTLRPDQYIVVRLSAKLPDGAQMDLDNL